MIVEGLTPIQEALVAGAFDVFGEEELDGGSLGGMRGSGEGDDEQGKKDQEGEEARH
jgi:hypothetical protein